MMRVALLLLILCPGCTSEKPPDEQAGEKTASEKKPPEKPRPGFGSDLKKAIVDASAMMKKGPKEATEAVMRLLSESQAKWLASTKQEKAFRDRLTARFTRGASMAREKWILSGLELAAKAEPQLTDGGKVAVFKIQQDPKSKIPREIKFQLAGGHWRFFDHGDSFNQRIRSLADNKEKP